MYFLYMTIDHFQTVAFIEHSFEQLPIVFLNSALELLFSVYNCSETNNTSVMLTSKAMMQLSGLSTKVVQFVADLYSTVLCWLMAWNIQTAPIMLDKSLEVAFVPFYLYLWMDL